MSFSKAVDLVRLARMAAVRRHGITLQDICDEFHVSHRTAQRMVTALADAFSNLTWEDGADRRRRWRVTDPVLARLEPRQEAAIEALEMAANAAQAEGRIRHSRALSDLRGELLARLAGNMALRTETDAEAVLGAVGQIARPGPRTQFPAGLVDMSMEALRGPFRMRFQYASSGEAERIVEPHGLLLGNCGYLVARELGGGDIRKFRLDRIHEPVLLDESFAFEEGFSLDEYAARSFGVFNDPVQFGEVIWRFAPEAADRASQFCFHPYQELERHQDGSLTVRFCASGWTEMTWHLYQWGDKVEVIAPYGLRAMVDGHRRSDFGALP